MKYANLRINDRQDGSWDLSLTSSGATPAAAHVTTSVVQELRRAAESVRRAAAAHAGDDATLGASELALGQALGSAAFGSPEMARRLGALCGSGATAVLVDGATDLPWELMAAGPGAGLFEDDGVVVVRHLPGPPAAPRGTAGGAAIWLIGRDPICRRLADELGVPASSELDDLPAAGALLVGAHGSRGRLRRAGGDLGTDGLGASLQGRSYALVTLLSCEAGDDRGVAPRLVEVGAPAVLAPAARVPQQVASAVGAAVVRAAGEGVLAATREARRAVRALGLPTPGARWWAWRLHIADPVVLTLRPTSPLGWPTPGQSGAAFLQDALGAGRRLGLLGLEALLEALGGPVANRVLPALVGRLGHLHLATGTRAPPRLERVGRALPVGFGREDVRLALIAELPYWKDTWDGRSTLRSGDEQAPNAPARGIEVLGGPEDGLRLFPASGQTIGRHDVDSAPDLPLYRDTPLVDPRLSRRHFTWLSPGRLRLARSGHRLEQGRRVPCEPGDITLEVGGLLELTPATVVRGVG